MAEKFSRVAILVLLGTTASWASRTPALTILAGSDYLTTVVGSFFDFSLLGNPFGLGVIGLEGIPTGPGTADTVVERIGDATLDVPGDTDTVDVALTGLSLRSVDPVNIGGELFDLNFSLDMAQPSVGQMSITLGDPVTPSGTFDSFFDVFVEITISDSSTNAVLQTFTGLPSLRLEGGGNWTSVRPPNSMTAPGLPGDSTANTHDPLAPGTFDFYIDGLVFEGRPGGGAVHLARNSVVPEPGTATLLCLGALGIGIRRRWHQEKREPLARV